MPIQTEYHAFLPILNEQFITFKGPSWWIADNLQVRSLTEQEARFISEQAPKEFTHRVEHGQKTLLLKNMISGAYGKVETELSNSIQNSVLCSQVVFNMIAESEPVCIPYAILVSTARISRIRNIYEFDLWGDTISLSKNKYRLKSHIALEEIKLLYNQTLVAIEQRSELRIALNRFCSALLKKNPHDKIIDLTIALESFIPGGGEFGFRFPYYLSLLVTNEPNERENVYSDLKDLYSARSGLVHGDPEREKDINKAVQKWDALLDYAKQCIFYRIEFESQVPKSSWSDHLSRLIFGQIQRIWDE